MKKKNGNWNSVLIMTGFIFMLSNSCKKEDINYPSSIVTDIDGNVYHTVIIGTQEWMVENLKTTKYRNGDLIPNITDGSIWVGLTNGAYCDYNNKPEYSATYGRLYNWYAIHTDYLCPSGWHVPSNAEWKTLATYLGGEGIVGGKLKEKGTTHWNTPNTEATNETGFTALPGGLRIVIGLFSVFSDIGVNGEWWSSTNPSRTTAYDRELTNSETSFWANQYDQKHGMSVRCIRD